MYTYFDLPYIVFLIEMLMVYNYNKMDSVKFVVTTNILLKITLNKIISAYSAVVCWTKSCSATRLPKTDFSLHL